MIEVQAASTVPNGDVVAARATIDDLDLDIVSTTLVKLLSLDATVVQATAKITGDCGDLVAHGHTSLAEAALRILGLNVAVEATPAPNTEVLHPALNALGIRIVLNEQIETGDGVTGKQLTVNAIHVYFRDASLTGLVVNGDIVIGSATAHRRCDGTCP